MKRDNLEDIIKVEENNRRKESNERNKFIRTIEKVPKPITYFISGFLPAKAQRYLESNIERYVFDAGEATMNSAAIEMVGFAAGFLVSLAPENGNVLPLTYSKIICLCGAIDGLTRLYTSVISENKPLGFGGGIYEIVKLPYTIGKKINNYVISQKKNQQNT